MGKKRKVLGAEFYKVNMSQQCNVVLKNKYVSSLNRDILGHTEEKQQDLGMYLLTELTDIINKTINHVKCQGRW